MKKLIYFTVLNLVVLSTFSQLPGSGISLESNVLDGVYIQEHIPTKRVVQYPHLREADVMWGKRVWRVIDLREKMNHKLYYPLEKLSDRLSLYDVIYYGAIDQGSLTVYDLNGLDLDDKFRFPVRPANGNISDDDKSSYKSLRDELISISKMVPKAEPWLTPNAQALDEIPISQWLSEKRATPFASWAFGWLSRGGFGTSSFEPFEASLLHLAWNQAVGPQAESPESWLVTKGAGEVAKILGEELKDDIELSSPVQEITDGQESIETFYGFGVNKTVNSSAVIVAIPPALRQKITFSPGLNGEYRQLLQRSPMGSKFKVFAVYAEAFWREEGYCGLGRGNLQILEEIADSGPVESNPGIMVSFVAGNKAAALNRLSDTEQRRLILEDFVRYLGPKAAEPLDLVVQRWIDEQWTTGGYTAFRTPGAWTGFGTTWQQPHGRIFWAGTEESTRWPGYFEGAIEAGIQAVDRAAAALDGGGN